MDTTTLIDALRTAEDTYDETVGQYRAECALYGDAWPGAAIDLQATWDYVEALRAQLAALVPPTPVVADEDLPF
jgi:hypothetical protein